MSDHERLPGRLAAHPVAGPGAWPQASSDVGFANGYLTLTVDTIVDPAGAEHSRVVVHLRPAVGAKKAEMADPAAAERATGYVVGGISPLGQKQRLRTVVDESALDHAIVYVSAGRRGLDVGLAPADLVALTDATTAALSRD